MKLDELIEAKRAEVAGFKETYDRAVAKQRGITNTARDEGRDKFTSLEAEEIATLRAEAATAEKRYDTEKKQLNDLERAGADEEIQELIQEAVTDTSAQIPAQRAPVSDAGAVIAAAGNSPAVVGARRAAYDQVHRVAQEERTYSAHKERGFDQSSGKFRGGAKPGAGFELDVAAAFLGDYEAQDRLRSHMAEERVERGQYLTRAVGTGAFAGLTVPQFLTDLYAPAAAAMRPFADVCRPHELPAQGMTVNLSRITTSTSVDTQSAENAAVQEQDIDDTLLTLDVLTNAGQQTLSRQAIERGTGVEPVVMDDLYRRYHSRLDNKLINLATVGLTNVAAAITYTDASPTVAEFIPLVSQAAAAVETALLDQASGETVALMTSRRWFWLNQALSSTFPMLNQPGAAGNALGVNYGQVYGRGFRGLLPNGIPVVVDNNISVAGGVGTNQDEVYVLDRNECHLWEDPQAPVFIRAEQPKVASLGVLLVLYGYYSFTHARYAHAQKIAGTGLVTPTWTGV